ncbi:MAG: PCYCGC motif-containing (lipo)protein [Tumebacillaceae bacterium]
MKRKHLLFGAAAALAILSGCGTKNTLEQLPAASEHHHSTAAESGDIRETTAAITKLPSFLDGQDPKIVQAYQMVAAHTDMLSYIPCYCGCESIGHTSSQSCFIKEIKQDGSIVWDDHGTRCTTCMNIAVIASKMQDAGKSPHEIRQYIDDKFKQGYAKPTPTPMPKM